MTEETDKYMRQAALVDRAELEKTNITMVGAGGIGSVTASFLTKMGLKNLTVYDFDDVEVHNLPNQMYPKSAVGKPKVEALKEYLEYMEGDLNITIVNDEFTAECRPEGIVISAVDSMEARKAIWKAVKMSPDVMYFIDGRMGGWVCQRLAVDMLSDEDIEYYETTLFDDDDALPLPCTERAIIFNTGAIGSMIADTVAKRIQGYEIKRNVMYDMRNSYIIELNG